MKYPYIGGIDSDCKVLFIGKKHGVAIEHPTSEITGAAEGAWCEDQFKNITSEYLANTYGEVVSTEHAEFIIELAKSNLIQISSEYQGGAMWFNFNYGILDFYESEDIASNSGEKQITIPLPPKQIQTATPEEEFEMTQIEKNNGITVNVNNNTENEVRVTKIDNDTVTITVDKPLKNAGDNLVLGCEQDFKVAREIINEHREGVNCSDELLAKCEDWPQVGDEVVLTDLLQHYDQYKDEYCNKVSKVIARFNTTEGEFITVHREYCAVMTVRVDRVLQDGALVKPKTPEEELRDDIGVYLCEKYNFITGAESLEITDTLLMKYNITKKPQ